MAMAHQPLAALLGVLVGVAAEEGCDLGLDGLRQQRSRALAQNFGERIGELCWLDQLDDIILDHGVSLLRWRSGGLEHPHDTPPQPRAVANFRAYLAQTSDEELIKSAMSAAPPAVAQDAAIVAVGPDGKMRTIRKGSNTFTCMPDNPA